MRPAERPGLGPAERAGLGPAPILLLLIPVLAAVFYVKPILPVDETRYTAVAWEMWNSGEWLVPQLNGEAYSHKPPVLFWLMHLGWSIFGVNAWWPRLLGPLALLLNAWMLRRTARSLWPEQPSRGPLAALIFCSALFPFLFSTALMFDLWLVPCVLFGWTALMDAHRGASPIRTILGFGLATGVGILTKGPVTLLFLLPPVLAVGHWSFRMGGAWKRVLGGSLLGLLLGAALALAWAIPAGQAGGEAYRNAIFWGQTAGRVSDSFAHARPIWWFLPLLPGMLYPWIWWPRAWRGWRSGLSPRVEEGPRREEAAASRFLFWCVVPAFLFLCAMSGKQPHYLLPLFAAAALGLAWNLSRKPPGSVRGAMIPMLLPLVVGVALLSCPLWLKPTPSAPWIHPSAMAVPGLLLLVSLRPLHRLLQDEAARPLALALCTPILVLMLHLALGRGFHREYDLKPMAQQVHAWQQEGTAVAYHGSAYYGQFHFLGRLSEPVANPENREELREWLSQNPDGRMLLVVPRTGELPYGESPYPRMPNGSRQLQVWPGAELLARME